MNWLILYSNFFVAQYLVIISENSWIKTTYLKKQTQFFAVSGPKTTIPPNSKPIQSQLNPIQTQLNPIQTQSCLNSALSASSVAINKSVKSAKSASKTNTFYAKRTQIPPFSAQNPRFCPKTNPKRTQNKPKQSQIYRGEAQRRRTYTVWAIWAIFTRRFLWRIEYQESSIEHQESSIEDQKE